MVFVREKGRLAVVDKERNITVTGPQGLWSDTTPPILKYVYEDFEFKFDFGIVSHEEKFKFKKNNEEIEGSVCNGIDIVEPSINRSGLHAQPLSPEKFREIKAAIKEGIYALCMPRNREDNSPLVPDFKVNFVQDVKTVVYYPSALSKKQP